MDVWTVTRDGHGFTLEFVGITASEDLAELLKDTYIKEKFSFVVNPAKRQHLMDTESHNMSIRPFPVASSERDIDRVIMRLLKDW